MESLVRLLLLLARQHEIAYLVVSLVEKNGLLLLTIHERYFRGMGFPQKRGTN